MPDDLGTIVVVEDDRRIAELLDLYLRQEGFRVVHAEDGQRGVDLVSREHARLVVLDIALPGELDGFEVCRRIRERFDVPVVMVTARDDEIDRVLGLELGADDYVTKPFSFRELTARVKAVLRRTAGSKANGSSVLKAGDVTIDMVRREVRAGDETVDLTAREFDLAAHFAANPGRVLTRLQLLDAVWGPGWIGDERTVDVHVRQLRKKLGDAIPIATIWRVGYRCG
jgi:DNA-binding response OmpR family regulator